MQKKTPCRFVLGTLGFPTRGRGIFPPSFFASTRGFHSGFYLLKSVKTRQRTREYRTISSSRNTAWGFPIVIRPAVLVFVFGF